MADNITLNSGSGGASLATDEISSVHHQRVKVQHGTDGTATDAAAASPLPTDAALRTDAISSGGTLLVPKFANISAASSGDNALVAAVASATIRVLSLAVVAAGEVDAYFHDGTDNLMGDATNKLNLDVDGTAGARSLVLPFNPAGWFQTGADNRPINLNLSGAIAVVGCMTYIEV